MKRICQALLICIPFCLSARPYSIPEQETAGKVLEQTNRRITPDAGPSIEGGIDIFITADFIYWTARMDGLAYVTSGLGDNRTSVSRGSVCQPDWEWDLGFKVGLGHNLPHDGWDIYAQYTWLHSSASDSKTGNTLDLNWNVSDLESITTPLRGFITSARSHWHLHYNIIDLALGRNYFISHYLSLRPHFGFKTSWQDVDYRVCYQSSEDADLETRLRMKNDADFWGIGLRTGLNTTWHINPIFSVYGNFALSGLWCQYETKRRDTRTDLQSIHFIPIPPLNTSIITYNTEKNFHTLKGVLELSIGLRGEWWFSDDRYHFLVQAGWEEQLWFNHNQFIKMHFVESAHGDMILQGFTMKFRFDF